MKNAGVSFLSSLDDPAYVLTSKNVFRSIKIILIAFFLFFLQKDLSAQKVRGVIREAAGNQETIPGASVYWNKTSISATTAIDGRFSLDYPEALPADLIVSITGFSPDTIQFNSARDTSIEIKLDPVQLKEVIVRGKNESVMMSTIAPINVQTITTDELRKAACCNLSESFETNASIDVNYTDAVSGAKQIQMLGLDGIYTQILSENVPLIRGLSSSYGLSYTPGTWIESILVTKGTGSVVNGYESITGQLQLEMIEPENAEKLFVNGYASNQARYETNLHYGFKPKKYVSSVLLTHLSSQGSHIDANGDSFMDMPGTKQANVLNRWTIDKPDKYCIQLGVKAMTEDRMGGQIDRSKHETIPGHYTIHIKNQQAEIFSKTGFFFPQPYKSLGIVTSLRYHDRSALFGLRDYAGEQKSLYINGIYETIIADTRHKIRTGASFVGDVYTEQFNDSAFNRNEFVPGAFGEYTFSDGEKLSLVTGFRLDQHNLYGLFWSPRVHFKYNPRSGSAIRLSAGKGYRTANVYVENAQIFASSRQVQILTSILPEEAWNGGITLTHKFKISGREGSLNLDAYRTFFSNQVVVDVEDPRYVRFYNLSGKSYSDSYQAELNYEVYKKLDLRIAGKLSEVKTDYLSGLKQKPLVPRYRALANLAYATKYDKWKFDFTTKWIGSSRIPPTFSNPVQYRLEEESPAHFILSAQVTKAFKHFDVYLGVENIGNFRQKSPILASDQPFGTYFDASMIWGPVNERMGYIGFRYTLKS